MMHRSTRIALAFGVALMAAGCHHNKVSNPIANIDSKQPDKVLFDRSMDAMKHGKYDVARITLQTLINTYPDSEYIARAKLAVGDSWYAEGTTAAYQQAEVEYKDFITFFPQLPEAAEAQLKIANMHYKQMEKPDRDYTHAMRAEDEYRQLINQFPDSKLLPQAKQRLREVQEVLAERQFRVGRFYYLRESYPAAIARLKTLTDTYPLYSQADDALLMLGRSYESEATLIKNSKLLEAPKMRLVKQYQTEAANTYDRIIQRYPLSDCAEEARSHLKDLGQPIPQPTQEAIAAYKAEEESRSDIGRVGKIMSTFHKAPDDLARASQVGEPTLVDPQQTSAPQIIRSATSAAMGVGDTGNSNVTLERAAPDTKTNDPIPRSDASAPGGATPAPETSTGEAPAASGAGSETGIQELTPNGGAAAAPPASNGAPASGTASTAADNSTAASGSSTTSGGAPQAPAQVNEIQNGSSSANASQVNSSSTSDEGSSTSKKKKKKGLKKIVPF
jgi:outer membrane protein assembly factor BamD